jgi:hypothetical protein
VVNTPGASVVLESSVIVTGTTIVQDVDSNTFTSNGTHTGGITVSDSNGTHLVLGGNAGLSTLNIASTGAVLLDGSYNNINITQAGAQVTLNGTVNGTLTVADNAAAGTNITLGDNGVIAPEDFVAPIGFDREVNGASVLQAPTLNVWEGNDNEEYVQGDVTFPIGSILQFNVNFSDGKTLADFSAAEVLLYVDGVIVGRNFVRTQAFTASANSVGLTGLVAGGIANAYEGDDDLFWGYDAYNSELKPDKVVFKVKDAATGLVYVVQATIVE